MKKVKWIAAALVCGLAVSWSAAQIYSYQAVAKVNGHPIRSFSGLMTRSTWEAQMMWPLGYQVVHIVYPHGLALMDGAPTFEPYTKTTKHYLAVTRTEKRPIE